MTQRQKNFVKGAVILGLAGLLAKVIGAFFRIPLAGVLGAEGSGYYGMAYPVYSALMVVSTLGIPTAISKMISERAATGDRAGAYRVFVVARRVFLIFGVASAVALLLCSGAIADVLQAAPAAYSFMAISPALFFVSVMSAYRGYFQGLQWMTPTAATQVIEQMGKLLIGLFLAGTLMRATGRPELGAAGALLGIAISEGIALAVIVVMYRKRGETRMDTGGVRVRCAKTEFWQIFKKMLAVAVPVTLGACVMPIVLSLDSVTVSRTLQAVGYAQKEAASLLGLLTMNVTPLINMPAALSAALAMSIVPAVAQAHARADKAEVSGQAGFGFQLAVLVGLPAAAGFALLAQPILSMLFRSLSAQELAVSAQLMVLMSAGVVFLTLTQTMTGILQGVGKQILPVISLLVGALVKVALSVALLRVPQIHIAGAAIGTLACFAVIGVMNVCFAVRYAGMAVRFKQSVLKPAAATGVMGVCVYFVWMGLAGWSDTVGVIAAIAVGAAVYAVMLLLLRALDKSELQMIPGGAKIIKWMQKCRIGKGTYD